MSATEEMWSRLASFSKRESLVSVCVLLIMIVV